MIVGTMIVEFIAFWLSAVPFWLALLNHCLYRTPAPARGQPEISVLIPARNEEANIGAACGAVLASRDVSLELIVLNDHSTDRTSDILDGIADPRLRTASAPALPPGWSGKQHACAELGRLARHELLVFVDADVRLQPDALSRMAGFMQRHDVGLASGFPREVTGSWSEQLLLPLIHFLLLGFLPILCQRLSVRPSLGAGCGQLFIARRRDYERVGGHAAIRSSLHDGLTLPRAFRRAGIMTGLFDASRFAQCRMYSNAAQVFEGLTKNATEGMAKPLALPIWTVLLVGGQVLPLLLLVSLPSTLVAFAAAQGFGARLLLAWRFRQSIVSAFLHPLGILALLAIQWIALIRAARGRPATWRGRAYPAQ
jgi:hypothetical protein